MKRFLTRLALCGLLALTSCAAFDRGASPKPAGATGAPVLGRIVARGELLVGTSGNQPPLNATTKSGEIIGLEADLAAAMAQAMGVALRFVPMPFGELLPALERGEVDLVLSSVTMTPQRNTRVAFVGPYFVSGKALLTKSKRMAAVKESGEIDNASTTLAALEGSTSQAFVQNAVSRATLVTVKDYDRAVRRSSTDRWTPSSPTSRSAWSPRCAIRRKSWRHWWPRSRSSLSASPSPLAIRSSSTGWRTFS